eukprot:4525563-Pleurochrysis_carterae.AAC.1
MREIVRAQESARVTRAGARAQHHASWPSCVGGRMGRGRAAPDKEEPRVDLRDGQLALVLRQLELLAAKHVRLEVRERQLGEHRRHRDNAHRHSVPEKDNAHDGMKQTRAEGAQNKLV